LLSSGIQLRLIGPPYYDTLRATPFLSKRIEGTNRVVTAYVSLSADVEAANIHIPEGREGNYYRLMVAVKYVVDLHKDASPPPAAE